MPGRQTLWIAALSLACLLATGCYAPPNRAQTAAVAGGVGGAGLGALVGSASGHPGVGALVGGDRRGLAARPSAERSISRRPEIGR